MRKASGYILCLLVIAAYVFSYTGVGIHTCHDDGTRHLVWLLGDVSCEAITTAMRRITTITTTGTAARRRSSS